MSCETWEKLANYRDVEMPNHCGNCWHFCTENGCTNVRFADEDMVTEYIMDYENQIPTRLDDALNYVLATILDTKLYADAPCHSFSVCDYWEKKSKAEDYDEFVERLTPIIIREIKRIREEKKNDKLA